MSNENSHYWKWVDKHGGESVRANPDQLAAKEREVCEHPTAEQLMMREALKSLTTKQRRVWEYFNYDRLTHDEIAIKEGVSRVAITKQIRTIEKRIIKWVNSNMTAYKFLKENT